MDHTANYILLLLAYVASLIIYMYKATSRALGERALAAFCFKYRTSSLWRHTIRKLAIVNDRVVAKATVLILGLFELRVKLIEEG